MIHLSPVARIVLRVMSSDITGVWSRGAISRILKKHEVTKRGESHILNSLVGKELLCRVREDGQTRDTEFTLYALTEKGKTEAWNN